MIRVFNKFEPIPKDFVEIDTTSRGPYKDLSPFYLGPYSWEEHSWREHRTLTCQKFENLWQYTKVYPQHTKIVPYGFISAHDPIQEYYEWRDLGFAKQQADRYPMGKGAKPLYSLWQGWKHSYIDARRAIYIPIYSELVQKTESYHMLCNMVWAGMNIALRDFDGYDHIAKGMTFEQVITNQNRSMGHAFVIFGLLTGEIGSHIGLKR